MRWGGASDARTGSRTDPRENRPMHAEMQDTMINCPIGGEDMNIRAVGPPMATLPEQRLRNQDAGGQQVTIVDEQ